MSLQLEVLHAQVGKLQYYLMLSLVIGLLWQGQRLVIQRWGDDVKVKDYEYGKSFSVEYWGCVNHLCSACWFVYVMLVSLVLVTTAVG